MFLILCLYYTMLFFYVCYFFYACYFFMYAIFLCLRVSVYTVLYQFFNMYTVSNAIPYYFFNIFSVSNPVPCQFFNIFTVLLFKVLLTGTNIYSRFYLAIYHYTNG